MVPLEFLLVALLALVFEAAIGYPDFVFRLIGHPVTWMGALIGFLDRTLNRDDLDTDRRRLNGVLAAAINVAASALVAAAIGSLAGLAGPADVIIANIIADVIIRMVPGVPAFLAPGGAFLAAGIIAERLGDVTDAILAAGLTVEQVVEEGTWATVLARRGEE